MEGLNKLVRIQSLWNALPENKDKAGWVIKFTDKKRLDDDICESDFDSYIYGGKTCDPQYHLYYFLSGAFNGARMDLMTIDAIEVLGHSKIICVYGCKV